MVLSTFDTSGPSLMKSGRQVTHGRQWKSAHIGHAAILWFFVSGGVVMCIL